jgi:hypothetical protein
MMRTTLLIAAIWGLLGVDGAAARTIKSVGYHFSAVWSGAVRMIRVDRRYPITDKDRKNGYILFTHPGNGAQKTCPASLELFEFKDAYGRLRIRMQLSITNQPSYVEAHFLDKLQQKLFRELGPAPNRKPKKPKKPDEDDKKKPTTKKKKGAG